MYLSYRNPSGRYDYHPVAVWGRKAPDALPGETPGSQRLKTVLGVILRAGTTFDTTASRCVRCHGKLRRLTPLDFPFVSDPLRRVRDYPEPKRRNQ